MNYNIEVIVEVTGRSNFIDHVTRMYNLLVLGQLGQCKRMKIR